MNKTTGIFIFVTGVAIGSISTWQYTKKKYEKIAQEEINSVKDMYSQKKDTKNVKKSDDSKTKREVEVSEFMDILKKEKYASEEVEMNDTPYVISPEEFGEIDDYDTISLTYYNDQILVDENDEEIEDVEGTIGYESLTHFGEYEDDSVFVRNDRLKCDYEILIDNRSYSEILRRSTNDKE